MEGLIRLHKLRTLQCDVLSKLSANLDQIWQINLNNFEINQANVNILHSYSIQLQDQIATVLDLDNKIIDSINVDRIINFMEESDNFMFGMRQCSNLLQLYLSHITMKFKPMDCESSVHSEESLLNHHDVLPPTPVTNVVSIIVDKIVLPESMECQLASSSSPISEILYCEQSELSFSIHFVKDIVPLKTDNSNFNCDKAIQFSINPISDLNITSSCITCDNSYLTSKLQNFSIFQTLLWTIFISILLMCTFNLVSNTQLLNSLDSEIAIEASQQTVQSDSFMDTGLNKQFEKLFYLNWPRVKLKVLFISVLCYMVSK